MSPSPFTLNLSQHQDLFQWISSSYQAAKFWSFSFSISPSNEYSGFISFRIDWFDLFAVQGTLKSLLQHHNSKASILQCSAFITVSGTRSGGLRKGQSPCELLGGLSGFLSCRCWGLRPCVESGPEPEDSSPVLTWILGYFWSLPRGVSPPLEWGHARALSS